LQQAGLYPLYIEEDDDVVLAASTHRLQLPLNPSSGWLPETILIARGGVSFFAAASSPHHRNLHKPLSLFGFVQSLDWTP
jgi:hypothetical protein